MRLEELGFCEWFKNSYSLPDVDEYELARVAAVDRNRFAVINEKGEVSAELAGKIIYEAVSSIDLPTVGDWVRLQYFNENTFAIIHEVLPRKSLLKRKTAGNKVEQQLIAANIDYALIIQSANNDFNIARLERYLTMVNDTDVEPVILLSKIDLISVKDLEIKISSIKSLESNYKIIPFSSKSGYGLDKITDIIEPAKTFCLIGSSGVGKTTLINKLIGSHLYTTGEVRRKDEKGRHITARRQLIILSSGALLIDTPGMRELGNIDAVSGLNDTFNDILILAENCRFNNCTHSSEPGCAVLDAVKNGRLNKKHFRNYLKLAREIEYNEMTYYEKRKKDRSLGKYYKQVMKHNKKI